MILPIEIKRVALHKQQTKFNHKTKTEASISSQLSTTRDKQTSIIIQNDRK